MSRARLAPGTPHTLSDAERWYAEQMGEAKLAEQKRLADIEARRCSCEPTKVKRRWEDSPDRALTRTVHDADCPRWKPWMYEVRPRA